MNENRNEFGEYLLAEYANISKAHFKTIDTISSFFRYYLILMAIPISALGIIFQFKGVDNLGILDFIKTVFPWGFLVISFIGFCMMLYVINLRLDAILYARTINGIRKYFFDLSNIRLDEKLRLRVLPQSTSLPHYQEVEYFFPVITAFACINALYFFFGYHALLSNLGYLTKNIFHPFLFSILYAVLHFAFYCSYTRFRETQYLKAHIIGVDIDGVLNKHKEHFCDLLKRNTGKVTKPNQITKIPVHECEGLDIGKTDADKVFNDPEYWTKMIPDKDSLLVLKKLKKQYKFKIFIFSHRPWPNLGKSSGQNMSYIHLWIKSRADFYKEVKGRLAYYLSFSYFLPLGQLINSLTKLWLLKHDFKYNKLFIEKGNENVEDSQGHYRNRFFISRENKIRFFIEDDFIKARKLSYICDIVFLLKHPYNEDKKDKLPNNVIMVDSWIDIDKKIRELV